MSQVDKEVKQTLLQGINSGKRPWELVGEVDLRAESSYLHGQLSKMDKALSHCRPDFLIISPGKTGTTWLSQNLNRHPDIFIPKVKEIKYFSSYWRWCDVNWYLRYFEGATHLKKGEATPSYAPLPLHVIGLIRLFMPEVKLIYMMRDPMARAWSQVRHEYKYLPSNFLGYSNFDQIPYQKFIAHFVGFGTLYYGDYLGCLKRWLTFFPKEQLFVEFYESIRHNPKQLLTDLFDFVGVTQKVSWSNFPINEKFQPSLEKKMDPTLKIHLRSIYKSRTEELCRFLKEQFGLEPPAEWADTLTGEERSVPLVLEEDYKGFRIALLKGQFYALPKDIELTHLDEIYLSKYQQHAQCFAGNLPDEVKYAVDDYLFHNRGLLTSSSFGEINSSKPGLVEADISSFDERLLTIASLGDIYSSEPRLVETDFRGFNIVMHKGKFYALVKPLGAVDLTLGESILNQYQQNKHCVVADSLEEVKQLVEQLSPQLSQIYFWGFNLVRYRGRYLALTKRGMGKVKRRVIRLANTVFQTGAYKKDGLYDRIYPR